MAKIQINWKLILVLILAVAAIAVTGIAIRKYHRTQRSEVGLTEGLKAYDQEQWQQAASLLGQYLSINQNDVPILIKYGQANARIRPFNRDHLGQAVNAYRTALRIEDNDVAASELIELYLQYGITSEAELIAQRFWEKTRQTQFAQFYATSLIKQRKFEKAAEILMTLVKQDPDQITAFDQLAQIAETQPDIMNKSAQEWFGEAIQNNPDSALPYVLRSSYWVRQGQLRKAIEDLEHAETFESMDAGTRLNIAVRWIQQGYIQKAQKHLDAVMQMDPQNERLWQIQALWAQQTNDPQVMKKTADAGLSALGEKNYSYLPLSAELYIKAGALDEAQKCIEKIQAAGADRGIILYLEGLLANESMDWATAVQKWQAAIDMGYASESLYLGLSKVLEQINNRPLAIQLLRSYTVQHENAYQTHLELGRLYARDRVWIEALEQATAAVQLRTNSTEARIFYYQCRLETAAANEEAEMKVLEKQIRDLVEAVDIPETRMLLFKAALKQKDYVNAEQILTEARNLHGQKLQFDLGRAELLAAQGKNEELITWFTESSQRFPNAYEVTQGLAWAYLNNKQYDQAKSVLDHAMNQYSDPLIKRKISVQSAEIEIMRKNTDEACEYYLRMAQENPSDIYVRRKLLSLKRDTATPEQLEKWIEEIRQAEGEDGWQWKYEKARMLIYDKAAFNARYSEIVEMLQQNLLLNPDDQASRILLATAYEKADHVQLALALYREVLARQPDNIDVIVSAVSLLYRAEEYRQAWQLLDRISQQGIHDPRLAKYELESNLRMGQMDNAVEILRQITVESPSDDNAKLSLALLLMRRGEYPQAKNLVDELLQKDPDSVTANAALADFYLSQNQPQKAIEVCDNYLTRNNTIQAHTMRCKVLLMMNRIPEAVQEIQWIEQSGELSTSVQLGIAELYRSAGQGIQADRIIQKLLQESPDDPMVLKKAVLANTQENGLALIEKAIEKNPGDVELQMQKARFMLEDNNPVVQKEAVTLLNRLIYDYPRLEGAWVMLGQWSLQQKKPAMALDYILRGLSYITDSKRLMILKAQAEAMRSPQLAIPTLEELSERYPEDPIIAAMLAGNYRAARQISEALAFLEKKLGSGTITETIPLKSELMLTLYTAGKKEQAAEVFGELSQLPQSRKQIVLAWVNLLIQEGHSTEAIEAFESWGKLYPQDQVMILPGVLNQFLQAKNQSDVLIKLEDMLKAVVKRNPDSSIAHYTMGMFLHQTGRKEQAVPWYEKTIQLDPKQVIAMNNLAWILSQEMSDLSKSLELVNNAVKIAPDYADLRDTKGVILLQMNRYEEAVKEFEACIAVYGESDPKRTGSIYRLAKSLYKLKKYDQATVELLRAKEMQRNNGGLAPEEEKELESMLLEIS